MQKVFASILLVSAVLLTGCRTAPIYNVSDAAIPSGKQLSMKEVESAIMRAGEKLGWAMRPVKPGEIEGRLALRTHVAVVSIPYTQKSYSIVYKNSDNLNYDGSQIHSNYNGWVTNLERRINFELGGS
jgi:hypothetical protein